MTWYNNELLVFYISIDEVSTQAHTYKHAHRKKQCDVDENDVKNITKQSPFYPPTHLAPEQREQTTNGVCEGGNKKNKQNRYKCWLRERERSNIRACARTGVSSIHCAASQSGVVVGMERRVNPRNPTTHNQGEAVVMR